MSNFQKIPDEAEQKDQQLWELAKARAGFKGHLTSYFVVISFLWIIWLMSGSHLSERGIPWPVWPMLGWGIGLTFHFLGAYVYPKSNMVEREYEKLKRDQQK
jgi:hypothetical protein